MFVIHLVIIDLMHLVAKSVRMEEHKHNSLDIREKFFTKMVVGDQNRLPGGVTIPEVFKRCVDVILRDMVQW